MKTIALFPGTDAIESPAIRAAAFKNKAVRKKIKVAEKILYKKHKVKLSLADYMTSENDRSLSGFQRLVICSLATQVAIFESYEKSGEQVDILLGLSLGDIARSVVSGLCSFEDAVLLLYKFTCLGGSVFPGLTVQLKIDQPLQEMEATLQLEAYQIEKSVIQNDYFLLVAGSLPNMKKWLGEVIKPNRIVHKIMYPFPLHSSLMTPIADALCNDISKACKADQKTYQIYSTVFAKELKGEKDIVNDSKLNIKSTLHFTETIRKIVAKYGKVKFVNIGPAATLLKFIEKMELNLPGVKLEDWFVAKPA